MAGSVRLSGNQFHIAGPATDEKIKTALDTINKQYKVPQLIHTTHLPRPGQRSTSSIHRQCSEHWGFAQWAVPRSWALALTVGYHTSVSVHSHHKRK